MQELMKNTAGECQPQGFHNHMTAANTMGCTNAKQMLIDGQDTSKHLQKTLLTRLAPGQQ